MVVKLESSVYPFTIQPCFSVKYDHNWMFALQWVSHRFNSPVSACLDLLSSINRVINIPSKSSNQRASYYYVGRILGTILGDAVNAYIARRRDVVSVINSHVRMIGPVDPAIRSVVSCEA